ncbi:MAG: hypothetical protein J7M34_07665 [Anaerolineae bacterium]|nr:hypothetical protein [Anaerolineae bacterium]
MVFLKYQYNPDIGLLQESPKIGRHNYYLNDAALAAYTLETLGEHEMATQLRASLAKYNYQGNGFFELAWGVPIRWPPFHHKDVEVARIGEDRILIQTHPGPGYFYDWSAYSNLAFMAAVNERVLGHPEAARRLYEIEMSTFDGLGWRDRAYWQRDGVYETLGLAWGIYASTLVGAPINSQAVEVLISTQGDSGGFHTHYRPENRHLADPNVETTCMALLALHKVSGE